jgi:hypothetical protein
MDGTKGSSQQSSYNGSGAVALMAYNRGYEAGFVETYSGAPASNSAAGNHEQEGYKDGYADGAINGENNKYKSFTGDMNDDTAVQEYYSNYLIGFEEAYAKAYSNSNSPNNGGSDLQAYTQEDVDNWFAVDDKVVTLQDDLIGEYDGIGDPARYADYKVNSSIYADYDGGLIIGGKELNGTVTFYANGNDDGEIYNGIWKNGVFTEGHIYFDGINSDKYMRGQWSYSEATGYLLDGEGVIAPKQKSSSNQAA